MGLAYLPPPPVPIGEPSSYPGFPAAGNAAHQNLSTCLERNRQDDSFCWYLGFGIWTILLLLGIVLMMFISNDRIERKLDALQTQIRSTQ